MKVGCYQCGCRIRSKKRHTCRIYGPIDRNPKTRKRVRVCAKCKKECGVFV